MGSKRANGEGCWIDRTINGNRYQEFRITIAGISKSFYGKNKKEALEKYKDYLDKNKIESTYDIQKMTFLEYSKKWLFFWRKQNLSPKTIDYYDDAINRYIRNTKISKMQIGSINSKSQKQIRTLFQDAINTNINYSKSINDSVYTVLNLVSKFGFSNADFVCNYMEGVEKLTERDVKTKTKKTKSLTYAQVMQLWSEMNKKNTEEQSINGKPGTYVYGINAYALLFICFTGLRWGEVSRLEWADIKQTENGSYYIIVDKQFIYTKNRDENAESSKKYITKYPKEEKIRLIPLSNQCLEILDLVKTRFPQHYGANKLIFSTTGNPISDSNARRTLRSLCTRANVPLVSPHELRHSFASILLNEDKQNLYAVSELLGHSSPDVTYKAYIDIFEKSKIDTISLFNNLDKNNDT